MAEEIEWFVGIDWASQSHEVCLVDANGEWLWERAVAHGRKNHVCFEKADERASDGYSGRVVGTAT
jgi:hypothetical protein